MTVPNPHLSPRALRILAPANKVEEVAVLAAAGARELYGGVQPGGWQGRTLSANQRSFAAAQFPSEEEFAQATREALAVGAPMHLTLNAPLYDPADYDSVVELAERAVLWGAAGVIASDLGLLARLAEAALPLELTLSTMAGAMNRFSLRFFRRFGVRRAVLPRHLTLEEMEQMVSAHADIAFEVFILVGRCPNEEAFCTFQHTGPAKRWPCEIGYELSTPEGSPLPAAHPLAQWWESWRTADRRLACGLCGIPDFVRMGVRYLKIVGRGGAIESKVADVKLVARFIREGADASEIREAYTERFGRPCHPLVCYVPELHHGSRKVATNGA